MVISDIIGNLQSAVFDNNASTLHHFGDIQKIFHILLPFRFLLEGENLKISKKNKRQSIIT